MLAEELAVNIYISGIIKIGQLQKDSSFKAENHVTFFSKGRGAIRADFGPKSELNFVAITI